MIVRPVTQRDAESWLAMRCDLWPDGSKEGHRGEITRFLKGQAKEPKAALVAEDVQYGTIGFAELSIRPCAEGCLTNRVAYLEGWYVSPNFRRKGIGGALVAAAEEWGRKHQCTEFGSDTQLDNEASAAAHRALGFEDAGLIRCFFKKL